MRVKSFKIFEMDSVRMPDGNNYPIESVYGSEKEDNMYFPEEFLAFTEQVKKWKMENNKQIMWSLFPKSDNPTDLTSANRYWDMYVKGDREMHLVEMGDKLVAVLSKDGEVLFAFDNEDKVVDLELVKDKI